MNEICCTCNLPKANPKPNTGSATFRYICRLCLMRAEDTEPIFIHPGDSTLADKIYACTGVQVDENAVIGPTSICMSCKTTIYKNYQFLELCQRNDKIIQNLLASHDKTVNNRESTGNELRLVIRTTQVGANSKPKSIRARVNSRRKSTLSNLELSTSASDVSWSDCDDDKDDQVDDDAEEIFPRRQLAYDTDTQEESPKRQKLSNGENRVPSLVIPLSRLNGGNHQSPTGETSYGRISRASTVEPMGEDDLFQCEFCDGSFPYRIQIKQHVEIYHPDKKHELACKYCSKTYFTTSALRSHCEQNHPAAGLYECKLCKRYFATQYTLAAHSNSLMHRANSGEAVYPRRKSGYTSPGRRTSVSSNYGSDYTTSRNLPRRRSSNSRRMLEEDVNPFENVYYDEVPTYKCDYCDICFDDRQSLAKHTDVRPCRVELEPLDLDLLLETVDLDELLMPLNVVPDVAIIEPPIEIVDLT